jgi:hypothetical protein
MARAQREDVELTSYMTMTARPPKQMAQTITINRMRLSECSNNARNYFDHLDK